MSDNDIKQKATEDFEEILDDVSGQYEGQDCSLEDLENIVKQMLSTLPKLKRDRLREEMSNMSVAVHENPTTFNINEGLSQSQGYKDRLTEIYNLAYREYKLRKRCTEMLLSAFNVISRGKSKDKREGEATMRYPIHLINLEAAEIFLDEVKQIMDNIKSISDSISRQGSMLSMQKDLGEYRARSNDCDPQPQSDAEEIDYKSNSKKLEWDQI
ncbi:MAG: hypothetical protein ACOCP8_03145 [archaeon]